MNAVGVAEDFVSLPANYVITVFVYDLSNFTDYTDIKISNDRLATDTDKAVSEAVIQAIALSDHGLATSTTKMTSWTK